MGLRGVLRIELRVEALIWPCMVSICKELKHIIIIIIFYVYLKCERILLNQMLFGEMAQKSNQFEHFRQMAFEWGVSFHILGRNDQNTNCSYQSA